MKTLAFLLMSVVNLIHCQDQMQMIVFTLQGVLEKLEDISDKLKGHEELLHRIPDVQEKLGLIDSNLQDECLEGSHLCGHLGTCQDSLFSFSCSCPSGYTWDGSDCADIDECAEGKDVCTSNAVCNNSIGSYSCSCEKPFEGDGRTSCVFQCRLPAKDIRGLGCIKRVEEAKTFQEMDNFCQEEGGRLLQKFQVHHLTDIGKTFGHYVWVGVFDKKWTSDESLVPGDLWMAGYSADPSSRCGLLRWDSSTSMKVTQNHCSKIFMGLCQFQLP
ncbi:uncharacterized protein [Palaemon carinicauda]|uniref:uncharacterized protein isoform X2 n=1 Tax=Palaemon carinicauda TaxID=392227 RepID=UPI0035B5B7D1